MLSILTIVHVDYEGCSDLTRCFTARRTLWIEVDVFSPSVPREPICARLGVPEIWRYSNDGLTVRLLTPAGVYADSATSLGFPFSSDDRVC